MESELPHDLIQEILLRLPVKSLVRFKCVRRSWHSHISDPHFAKSHYELSAAPSHRLLHITLSGTKARSIDFDSSFHDAKVSFIPPLLKGRKGKLVPTLRIWGSCRGFVLIERYPNLYIWNPLTGFRRHLSHCDIGKQHHYPAIVLLIGFGYDPSTDDYLIVVLWGKFHTIYDHDDMQTSLMLFSFRTNSWKEIQGLHVPSYYVKKQPFVFNDAIHWLALSENKSDAVILAFDFVKKNFYEISLPDGDFTDSLYFYNLVKMGECLGLCNLSDSKTVWVMKEYKVKSSWTMFEIPDYLSDVRIAIAGELVVLYHASVAELMKFNDKGELLEQCKYYCNDMCGYRIATYTESLLSLPRNSDGSTETPQRKPFKRNRNMHKWL
ncbi:F-box/kelch-repeat protein At3g23880-like [Gastrolobium bilobum]|uniref:F-box/kelch-repeat protein At3g23880-like n=1 Tax=Gastrolobium bilobum TaxID=150636 RepID=UPI002AB0ACD5|nr:F-box/kelch-repeat protein At3g23880-like [Gastrolobium bilobum]